MASRFPAVPTLQLTPIEGDAHALSQSREIEGCLLFISPSPFTVGRYTFSFNIICCFRLLQIIASIIFVFVPLNSYCFFVLFHFSNNWPKYMSRLFLLRRFHTRHGQVLTLCIQKCFRFLKLGVIPSIASRSFTEPGLCTSN